VLRGITFIAGKMRLRGSLERDSIARGPGPGRGELMVRMLGMCV